MNISVEPRRLGDWCAACGEHLSDSGVRFSILYHQVPLCGSCWQKVRSVIESYQGEEVRQEVGIQG